MLTQTLWWGCIALMGFMLARALGGKFLTKYPVFYFYLAYVLLLSLARFYFYVVQPGVYQFFYWYTQFLSVAVGYCVIWEIYGQALSDYPGARRMAQQVLLAVLIVVVAKFLSDIFNGTWSQGEASLERNFRIVQAMFLLAIVGLLAYYAIPIGRNLRGTIIGYGFFLGTSVINLTLRSHLGDMFQLWWQYLQSTAYFVTLVVWSAALWSYQPNPKPEREIAIERDYEILSAQTARALAKARSYILRAVQP